MLSVVIPCYNRADLVPRLLDAYESQTIAGPFEVIAVDDASTDGTPDLLTRWTPRRFSLTVHRLPENHGPAHARNVGIGLASGEIVLIAGDDVIPQPDMLRVHLEQHEAAGSPDLAVIGPSHWPDDLPVNTVMRHITGVGGQQFVFDRLHDGQTLDFRYFYTSNVSLSRALLDRLDHGFDEDFTHAAYEDIEFSYRLSLVGMRVVYAAGACGHHYHVHTARSFAARQFKSGLMAHLLIQKHPPLRGKLDLGLPWLALVGRLAQLPGADRSPYGVPNEAIEDAALALAEFYADRDVLPLDDFYSALFKYFYLRGLATAALSDDHSRRVQSVLVRDLLVPAAAGFLKQAGPTPDTPRAFFESIHPRGPSIPFRLISAGQRVRSVLRRRAANRPGAAQ